MGSDIVVVAPKDLTEAKDVSKMLALSALMPMALRKKPEDVMAIVLAGSELGLAPMQAVRGFDLIQGKISMSSTLIGALIMSSPDCEYLTPVEATPTRATYKTKRRGSPEPVTMSFTIQEARDAGLTEKDNWRKNPTAMLLARAQSRIGRAVYPDKCLGVYDRDSGELDELAAGSGTTQAATVESASMQQHATQVAAELKKALEPEDAQIVEVAPAPAAPVAPAPVVAKPLTLTERIKAATTEAQLIALGPEIKALPMADKQALHPIYAARRQAIAVPA